VNTLDEGEAVTRRILFVDHTASLGGAQLALLRLVRTLDHRRFDIRVILFSDGPLTDKLRSAGAAVEILPLSKSIIATSRHAASQSLLRVGTMLTLLRHVVRLSRIMRIRKVDLVHTNSLKSDFIGGLAALLAGKTLIWHIHDRIAGDYMPRMTARAFWLLALLVPSRLILNSQSSLEALKPYPITKCDVIFPGVDLAEFPAVKSDRESFDPVVGIVGRLSPTKGQDIFLRAASLVHRRHPNVQFQIVGSAMFNDADYEGEMRRLADSLGISAFVEFVGFVDDIGRYLPRLSILVHASTTPEPFGQVIVEAMAAGVPVVAVGTGGVPEIVVKDVTGLLVPPADSSRLAEAICEMLENPSKTLEMATRARKRVEDLFAIQRTARMVENVYDKLLGPRRFKNTPVKTIAEATGCG
jgi:glycosyltransferase involved in cell wall biosynthesis